MGLMASGKDTGSNFEPLPEGSYLARCVTVCDMGIQPTGYGSKEKVYLGFEVPSERVEWEKDGKKHTGPAFIGSRYTLSVHKKSILGQHLTSWRGKAFTDEELESFDVMNVLGAPCMISVVHTHKNENTYANISAIMKVPTGTPVLEAETELIGYTALDPKFSGTLDKLPEWLKKLALEGQRQQTNTQGREPVPPLPVPTGGGDFDDDIPF
jgi:hypothetical protein